MVLDADTAAVVGDIPGTNGVQGIAIAGDMDKGFISYGRDGNVTIFDTKTLKVLRKKRELTAIAIDYVPPEHWVVGGATLAAQGKNSFYLPLLKSEWVS